MKSLTTLTETAGRSLQDGILAEKDGRISTCAGLSASVGESYAVSRKKIPSPPTTDDQRREMRPTTGNRRRFRATIRFVSPIPQGAIRDQAQGWPASVLRPGMSRARRPPNRKAEDGKAGWRVLLERLPDAIFLLDPCDPCLANPVRQCPEPICWQRRRLGNHVWTLGWPILECNAAALRQSGYGREELIGQPIGLVGPRTDQVAGVQDILTLLKREKCVRIQGFNRRRDGTIFPVEVSYALVELSGRDLVLNAHRDATNLRRAQDELTKLNLCLRLNPHPVMEFNRAPQIRDQDFGQLRGLIRELSEIIKANQAKRARSGRRMPIASDPWQTAGDGLIAVDGDGRIRALNPGAERLTGYRADEIVGVPLTRLDLLDSAWVEAQLKSLSSAGGEYGAGPAGVELVRRDGRRVRVEASVCAPAQEPGRADLQVRPAGFLASTRDQSSESSHFERKVRHAYFALRELSGRADRERALRERETDLNRTQRISRLGSWELDLGSGTLEWSEETFRLLGFEPASLVPTAEAFFERIHPAHRESVKQARADAVHQTSPYTLEYQLVQPDGTASWVFEQADWLSDENGQALRLLGTIQDISERKEREERVRQLEKWEAIGRLAGGVAQEFNSVLTEMGRCSKAIESSANTTTELAHAIKQISAAAQRATQLTWHFLAGARQPATALELVDVNQVVTRVAQTLQRAFVSQIQLRLDLASDLPAVAGDGSKLEQILLHLALNMRPAVPPGAPTFFAIETSLTDVNPDCGPEGAVVPSGRQICLRLADTGHGGDTATTACLFEPFFIGRDNGPSGGLELATVDGLIQQLHGRIEIVSDVNHGPSLVIYLPTPVASSDTTFVGERDSHAERSFTLSPSFPPDGTETSQRVGKRAWGEGQVAADCSHSGGSSEGKILESEGRVRPIWEGTETILVVEADPLLRALTRSMLESYGYRIWAAGSDSEAWAIWKKHARRIELLLTSFIATGERETDDLAEQFKAQCPKLKVLYACDCTVAAAAGMGRLKLGLNFLPRPYSATALAHAVRRALDHDALIPEKREFLFEVVERVN